MKTIRQVLAAKKRVWLASLVVVGAAFILTTKFGFALAPSLSGFLSGGLALLWLLLGVSHWFWLKCPRCSATLNSDLSLKLFKPINYCPYCGASLDENVER